MHSYQIQDSYPEREQGPAIVDRLDFSKDDPKQGQEYAKSQWATRKANIARCIELSKELTDDDLAPLRALVAEKTWSWARFRNAVSRRWLWNVSFPVRMWFHFAFCAGQPLPDNRRMVETMLRDAFTSSGVVIPGDWSHLDAR